MKSVPTALRDAIRSSYVLSATPRLIADWNMNRYADPVASNTPDEETEGYDPEMFPIESIIEPVRPTKGICKARINHSVIGDDYGIAGTPSSARYYIGDVDDVYKYWNGPYASNSTGAISGVEPQVIYARSVNVNKIVAKVENSWASPGNFTVQITTDGTSWSTVATNPTIRNDGQVVLYYNGTNWNSNRPTDIDNTKSIRGVKLVVTSLVGGRDRNGNPSTYMVDGTTYSTSGKNSHFNLISLEAHLEADLSSSLIEVTDTFDMGETSQLYPIGTITANIGDLSLSNIDGTFNNDNTLSPYFDLLEPNVEFSLEYVYSVNGTAYSVQQFKMYSENWTGQRDDTVRVTLRDASYFLAETTPRAAMWEGLTAPQIVWRLLDSVGFVDYQIDADDRVVDHTIPVFWVDGSQNVWEVLDELAKSMQAAIYFDAFGVLQVKTRDIAFDDAASPVWNVRAEDSGTELADITSEGFSQTEQFEVNHMTVSFQATAWSEWNNGQPSLQKVWQPESTVVLRSSPLVQTLELDSVYLYIPAEDAAYWPWEGKVNVQGELIAYKGKHYVYYEGGDRKTTVVSSEDDRKKADAKTAAISRYLNHFTGGLKIVERGVWNSDPRRHQIDSNGYSRRNIKDGESNSVNGEGLKFNRVESTATLKTPGGFDSNDLSVVTRGSASDSGYRVYGTVLKFDKDGDFSTQSGGLVIHNSTAKEDGYYIDVRPTSKIDRTSRNELIVWSRVDGKNYRVGGKGAALAVAENIQYDMDVFVDTVSGNHVITVFWNGRNVFSETVPNAQTNAKNGKWGVFAMGKTSVDFEYLYAIARNEVQPPDDSSFFDMVTGGYRGGMWDREWVYRWRTDTRRKKKKSVKERNRFNQYYFDEFGPVVHEIREFNVSFDPNPVLHSRLYMTNDWSAICTEYLSSPFGAKFIIANTARRNAVVNGDDTITYTGIPHATTQSLSVLGRALVISETEKVIASNDSAIQRRGKIESELSEKWIQTKEMATDVSEWMKKHWGTGTDGAQVTIFGNPLIEIGDVVTVYYPHRSLNGVKYFVTGTSTVFSQGMQTTLTLRRVVV